MNDKLLTAPTIDGDYGRAWEYTAKDMEVIAKGRPHATVADWLVECSWAHPFWWNYRITVFHLRPVRDLGTAKIHLDGATHEMLVAALDPEWSPRGLRENPFGHMLQPFNFAAQFIEDTDNGAALRIRKCVEEIVVHSNLSPDTDYVKQWIARFGSNMIRPSMLDTVGQTKITLSLPDGRREEVVFDPKPADAKPPAKKRTREK